MSVDISVCCCTFNRAGMLRGSIESLFAQKSHGLFSFEIVLVDDGSTDETRDVADQLAEMSPVPFRYVRQDNRGVGSARNRSVRDAEGEWIAFFDDDQIASSEWLYGLYRVAAETNADCVGGPYKLRMLADCQVHPIGTVRMLLGENPLMGAKPSFLQRLDPRSAGLATPGTGNALVKKEVFFALGGFQGGVTFGEDFLFFRKLVKSGYTIAIAPEATIQHLIPASRLAEEYLMPLAEKAASFRFDVAWREGSRIGVFLSAAARLTQLAVWKMPLMLAARAVGREDIVLATRCSAAYTLQHSRECFDRLLKLLAR